LPPARRAPEPVLLVPLLAAVALFVHRGSLWSRELTSLSPIPAADQALDARLRADLGAPDVRYMVVVPAADREAALAAAQVLSARLTPLIDAGAIGGFESPTLYLPARRAPPPP